MAHETWSLLSLHASPSASSIILTTSAENLYYQHKSRKQLFFSMKTSSHSVPYTCFALRANSQAEDIKISKRFEGNALKKKICISGLPQSWSFLVHLAHISAVTRDTNLNKMKHSGNTLIPPEAIICVSEELRHMDYTGRCFHFYPRDWCWQLRADPGSQQADVLSNSLGNFWLSFLSWHHYLELTASWPERCWIHEMQRSFQLTTPCKLYIALLFHVQPPKISEQFKDRNQVQNCDPYLTSVS